MFETNANEGYKGIGNAKFDLKDVTLRALKGTGLDFGGEVLRELPVGNKAQIGRWQNLIYKPTYQGLLMQSQRNESINSFFSSGTGKIITDAINSAATNVSTQGGGNKN